jgi:hypothetical protein
VSTDAILMEMALLAAFAAGILYWVFVTPKREQERWRKQLDVGEAAPPAAASSRTRGSGIDLDSPGG